MTLRADEPGGRESRERATVARHVRLTRVASRSREHGEAGIG
jgi:hypothetical protein